VGRGTQDRVHRRVVNWLLALVDEWRARRRCFHHDHTSGKSWVRGRLVDLGRRKLFDCDHCGKTWT
jgi:hypothetical protein